MFSRSKGTSESAPSQLRLVWKCPTAAFAEAVVSRWNTVDIVVAPFQTGVCRLCWNVRHHVFHGRRKSGRIVCLVWSPRRGTAILNDERRMRSTETAHGENHQVCPV